MFGGIAVAKNLLCVAHSDVRGRVFLIDLDDRRPVSMWDYGPDDGDYADAGGVAMAADFMLYVADTRNDLVRCFTPFGKEVGRIGLPPTRSPGAAKRDQVGRLDRPRAVAVYGPTVYVACGEQELRRGVQRFGRDGSVLQPLRAFGDAEGVFGAPRGIWADERGVLVADTLHGVVQRFDAEGRFIGHFQTAVVPGATSRPVAVVRLEDGDVLVADQGDRRGLSRFEGSGAPRSLGSGLDLHEPVDLARDSRGRTYVLDRDGERVRRLDVELGFDVLIVDLAEIQDVS